MIARSLVAKRAVNDDKIWSRSGRSDLACRRNAHQQLAAAGEQFFRDQDGERRAYGAADDPDRLAGKREGIERGVVAGPVVKRLCLTGVPQPTHDIAIGVQDADAPAHRPSRDAFCRRASRSSAAGWKTDGDDGFLLSNRGGMTFQEAGRSNTAP